MTMLDLEMNALDIARDVAGLGVNWFIQSSLLIVAGLWIGAALRSKGSAVQSAVYRTTLAAVLMCPLVSWGLSQFGATGWSLEMPAAYMHEEVVEPPSPTVEMPPQPLTTESAIASQTEPTPIEPPTRVDSEPFDKLAEALPAGESESPAVIEEIESEIAPLELAPVATFRTNWFGIAAIAVGTTWLLLGGWLLARLAYSWRQLVRIRRTAVAADKATIDTCRNVAELFRVAPPTVLHSPFLPSPCLAGLRRPAVLLPDAELGLPVRDVLIHELAHLARGDCYWNLLRRIGTALLFFQPLMWRLSRCLDSTAEEVCDDYVVQFGGDRREYAHRLVDIAELSVAPVAAAGVGIVSLRSMLAARVARIMDTSRSLSTRVGHALLALVLLCGLLGTMLAGLVGVGPGNETVAADATTTPTEEVAADNAPAEAAEVAEDNGEFQTVRGHVVDSEGSPIAGAHVTAAQVRWLDERWTGTERRKVGEVQTGTDGRFEIDIPKVDYADFGKNRLASFDWKPATITATAPGYAAAWIGGDWYLGGVDPLAGEVTLQLKKESPTIRGRLVNLEGQPQAGLSVKVMSLGAAEPGKVDDWIAGVEQLSKDGMLPRAGEISYFTTAMVVSKTDSMANERRSAHFPSKWRLLQGDPSFPTPVRTDAEGRFEISGLPPDCLAVLQISGPGVATQSTSVVTRTMATMDVPNTGLPGDDSHGYHGIEFDYAVAPGTAIFGTVTDTETGTPLSGMQVTASSISLNRMLVSRTAWTTRTDEEGRYRIEGLPIEGEKRVSVTPTPDQPYLSAEDVKVKDTNEVEPLEVNIKLRRGVVVRGKVTVAETGEPVDATLHYHPFLNNDFAKQYDRFDPQVYRYEGNDIRHRASADGSFQTVVIPGRGILAVHAIARGEFCTGLGGDGIETNEEGRFLTYNLAFPNLYQRVLTIDVPSDASEVEYNLTVSRGISLKYAASDPQGQPLNGVLASGTTSDSGPSDTEPAASTVEFKALRPGEKRRVTLLHRERGLGRVIEIVAPPSAEPDAQPRSVTLLPCATVEGRLINGEGEPIPDFTLTAFSMPPTQFANAPQQTSTDANGAFRLEYLPVGASYRVGGNNREYGGVEIINDLSFEPGEKIDVGTIDVTKKERPEPKRTAAAVSSAATKSLNDSDDVITVRGTVVDPNGNPVAGADVYVLRWYWDFGERKPLAQVKADAAGRFETSYRKSQFFDAGRPDQWREAIITAFADGFGPGWLLYEDIDAAKEPTIRLVVDEVPIEGRIVDLEGNPVSGATIEMGYMNATKNEDLSEWLVAVRAGQSISTAAKFLDGFPAFSAGRWQDITTDADGRFRMTGIGRERQVKVHVKHPTIVTTTLSVVTRVMSPVAQPAYDSPQAHNEINYGARFEFAAPLSRPVEGIVRDAKSGEPIAGVEIWSSKFAGENISGITTIRTKSDDRGRYRLEGMPKGGGNEIYIVPTDLPYFTAEFELPDPPGVEPAHLDIELDRGVWVTGRVTNKETGRPVSARMYYIATPNNALVGKLQSFKDGTHIIYVQDRYRTAADGSYRVVALPGRGIIGVGVVNDAYPGGQGYDEIADLKDHDSYMKYNSALAPSKKYPTAVKEIHVPETGEGAVCDFALDPGGRVTLRVVDAVNNPLEGVLVDGIRETHGGQDQMRSAEVELLAFRNGEKRTVLLHHEGRRLGKALRVAAEEGANGPVTVKLEPCATVTGRLVDGDGEPVRGVNLRIHVSGDGGYSKTLPGIATDADGRFQHDAFLPGLAYNIIGEGAKIEFASVAGDLEVKPGESVDLGTIDITSDKRPETTRKMVDDTNKSDLTVKPAQSNQPDESLVAATGRVLRPDGTPAAGAQLFFAPRHGATADDLMVRATAGADGRFRFAFPRSDLKRLAEGLREPWSHPYIVARMTGFGPVRTHIVEPADAGDVTLKLVADDVPVNGRIVDLEGQPVAGALLRVLRIEGNPDGSLDRWLQGLKNFGEFWNGSGDWLQETINQDISGLPAVIRTDENGVFSLRGMGRERVVHLRLEAPQLETTDLAVMARAGDLLAVPLKKENPQLGTFLLYGHEFSHSAAPSQPVQGIVRDAKSGAPIADVTLYCEKRAGTSLHGRYQPETTTDAEGRYQLNGLPKGRDNEIAVIPPKGAPYAPRNIVVDTSQGLEPQMVDVDLQSGALIRGRVTDESTGKPVAGARVEYFAALVNQNIEAFPGFRDADDITTTTDADGKFAIVGIPGRGFIAVRAASDEFTAGQQIDTRDEDYEANNNLRDTLFATHPHTCIAEQHHAVAAVEIAENQSDVSRDIALRRGVTRRAVVLDADGSPLIGAHVNRKGLYACEWLGGDVELDDAEFVINGLEPNKPRALFLRHEKRSLVGGFVVKTSDVEPIEVRLQPAGSIVGRLVDEDKKPAAHVRISGTLADGQGALAEQFFRASSDEAGHFRVAWLIPDLKYQIRNLSRVGDEYMLAKRQSAPRADLTVVGGGELNIGDILMTDSAEIVIEQD